MVVVEVPFVSLFVSLPESLNFKSQTMPRLTRTCPECCTGVNVKKSGHGHCFTLKHNQSNVAKTSTPSIWYPWGSLASGGNQLVTSYMWWKTLSIYY